MEHKIVFRGCMEDKGKNYYPIGINDKGNIVWKKKQSNNKLLCLYNCLIASIKRFYNIITKRR